MSFPLPPLSLPADIIAKQAAIQGLPGLDKDFMNAALNLGGASNLFANPFLDQVASLKQGISLIQSIAGYAPGAATQSISLVTDTIQMLQNFGANTVPMTLTTPEPLASAISAGATAGASGVDADIIGPFAKQLGLPSLGTIMTMASAQYSIKTLTGTINAANPLPLLNDFSSMISGVASGATSMASGLISQVTNIIGLNPADIPGALGNLPAFVGNIMTSSFGGPLSSFAGKMFSTIKDQMSVGLGTAMRQMCETNFALKFMLTGLGSTSGGAFAGMVSGGLTSAMAQFPSPVNAGNIITNLT